jgi:uncharacterized membrane protein YhaH (DUF805 family)
MAKNIGFWFSLRHRVARRAYLIFWAAGIALGVIGQLVALSESEIAAGLYGLAMIPWLWLGICVNVKRLHDVGKSGWLALLLFVPIANVILFGFLAFTPGVKGANEYGPEPAAA